VNNTGTKKGTIMK